MTSKRVCVLRISEEISVPLIRPQQFVSSIEDWASGEVSTLASNLGRPLYLVADERRVFFVDVDRRTIEKLVR